MKEAKLKAFETYYRNTYLYEKFLYYEITSIEKQEWAGNESPAASEFTYSNKQIELADFSEWLEWFVQSEKFNTINTKFISIQKQLLSESSGPKRDALLKQERNLLS